MSLGDDGGAWTHGGQYDQFPVPLVRRSARQSVRKRGAGGWQKATVYLVAHCLSIASFEPRVRLRRCPENGRFSGGRGSGELTGRTAPESPLRKTAQGCEIFRV